jgi:hypothetical protein
MLATSEAGRLWEAMGEVRARVRTLERDMRESRRKTGIPLWGHIAAMGLISGLSALGLIKPETALSMLRLLGKAFTG